MREWLDATITSIVTLKPTKVLEIGFGTGMILHALLNDERVILTLLLLTIGTQPGSDTFDVYWYIRRVFYSLFMSSVVATFF